LYLPMGKLPHNGYSRCKFPHDGDSRCQFSIAGIHVVNSSTTGIHVVIFLITGVHVVNFSITGIHVVNSLITAIHDVIFLITKVHVVKLSITGIHAVNSLIKPPDKLSIRVKTLDGSARNPCEVSLADQPASGVAWSVLASRKQGGGLTRFWRPPKFSENLLEIKGWGLTTGGG